MAADPFSQLGPFDCKAGDFEYYSERFEHIYEVSNELEDEKVKATKFILTIGTDAYTVLKGLCKKDKPRNKTFDELRGMLLMHFSRRDFYQRNRKPGESLGDYRKEIERLAQNCFFGPFNNQIISDRIAGGWYLPVGQDNSQSSMVESSVRNQPYRLESTISRGSYRSMSRGTFNYTRRRDKRPYKMQNTTRSWNENIQRVER